MSGSHLPEHPSLEYLKKVAKDRLRELRVSKPDTRLADAQLSLAREYGFPSWRALRLEVDRRSASTRDRLFGACAAGDLELVRAMLDRDAGLVHKRNEDGATPLHVAVRHPDIVRVLLEHGADPNARELGDNALPLHFAAGGGLLESARMLLDAGSDVNGSGDAHTLDVIGWATVFAEPQRVIVDLLVSRGARHHVFSATALRDVDLLRRVVAGDPTTIHRRLSRFEQEQTALHYVIAPADGLLGGTFRTGAHYGLLDVLIELGADLEARDARGRTPLEVAMLRGDIEAMRRLHSAGAVLSAPNEMPAASGAVPHGPAATREGKSLDSLRAGVGKLTPMLAVPDMARTIAWYEAIGFVLTGSHGEQNQFDWAAMAFGDAGIMFVPSHASRDKTRDLDLWILTERLDALYARLKQQQLAAARAALADKPVAETAIHFVTDLYTAFYGQREFAIRDPNGIVLNFFQPLQ